MPSFKDPRTPVLETLYLVQKDSWFLWALLRALIFFGRFEAKFKSNLRIFLENWFFFGKIFTIDFPWDLLVRIRLFPLGLFCWISNIVSHEGAQNLSKISRSSWVVFFSSGEGGGVYPILSQGFESQRRWGHVPEHQSIRGQDMGHFIHHSKDPGGRLPITRLFHWRDGV